LSEPEYGSPEHWANERPDTVAVVAGDAAMTYREWNDRADRVAEGLSRLGLGPGDRLGTRFRLGLPWFVVQRALQKLGVGQVAVNWRLTPAEAAYIIHDSGAQGLACDDRDPAPWLGQGVGVLVTVGQASGAAGVRYEDLLETSDSIARYGPLRPNMVLYTSGTTGAPRGVPPLNPAGADVARLMRYMASVSSVPPTPDGAVMLLTLPVHHGAGAGLATAACAAGGTVVVLDPYDPEEALRLIERHRVQSWTGVPTMLLRVQALPADVVHRYDLSSLVALNTGAAPVPQSLKEWIVGRLGDGMLWEGYGASEAGMVCFARPEHQLAKPGTSGLPYDGVEIAIVDDEWTRLPPGATGEIAVNTPVVINGYLGRDPFGDETVRDGFYRTGDVGHLDEDGFLFITDRIKDMIVAGGVNIYPAEIEKVLVEHSDVVQAAVIGVPEPEFGEQPLAFVVARPGSGLDAAELMAFLDGRLASYKKPRRFVFVEELPVNPTGKVLKTELRAPYWEGRDRRV
jgi:long-chain acyl-CoA synthetase